MTEQDAINRITLGDTESFGALYDLYLERIYRFVYFRTHHKQTAEDLTSLVFTKAFSKFASFDRKANFATWIYSIARNTVIDHYRTSKSTVDINDAFDLSDKTNLTRDYELKEKLEQVKQFLDKLPADQRELVVMRLWDGLSYEEIAEITGKNQANLRVSFSRTMARISREMTWVIILLISLRLNE